MITLDFQKKLGLIFHLNQLPAVDSHEISSLIWFHTETYRSNKKYKKCLLQILIGALMFLKRQSCMAAADINILFYAWKGYSKELSQWDESFEHPKHMFKRLGKKIFTILC